jgi:hypothetical protein
MVNGGLVCQLYTTSSHVDVCPPAFPTKTKIKQEAAVEAIKKVLIYFASGKMERILFIEFFKLRGRQKGKKAPDLSKNLEMRIFREFLRRRKQQ